VGPGGEGGEHFHVTRRTPGASLGRVTSSAIRSSQGGFRCPLNDGHIVGGNFFDECSEIAGVGPISVDPNIQGKGFGRILMEDVLARARERPFSGVRLATAAYNNQSLCLYTKLGFRAREPLSIMSGAPPRVRLAGHEVRAARQDDIESSNLLCRKIHGHSRAGEVEDAVREKTATVVERDGRVTGYATSVGYFAHAVSETNEDMMGLIAAASRNQRTGHPGSHAQS
jgi:GNAT superfamily N-acetyltransferase